MAANELVMVFAKPAMPGAVKTRLLDILTPEQAARFHLAALSDVVTAARRTGRPVELHVAGGADACDAYRTDYPGLSVMPQSDGDLGARIVGALEGAFERGFLRAVIVGSDHPTIPPTHLTMALDLLAGVDLAFGPAHDGGYYAVAARSSAWPAARTVFEAIPWSTAEVLEATLRRVRTAGLSHSLTPGWYDVDRPEDLHLLDRDAAEESAALRFIREALGRV
ncbi:MAG: TIGR04282 family arsenosugar biosynthesis glycosyltransferase [Gemmatimonadales bacterium]|jgi:rSAM/selenodomain-associated transferase 1